LLSKNRPAAAKKSLQWLRGWAPEHDIAQEYDDLQRHSERSKSCNLCIKKNIQCTHQCQPTMREKFAELKRKQTLKPFAIVMGLFFLAQFSGVFAMRPFIMQIFKAYNSPIEPDRTAAIMSLMDNLANVVFMCLVRFYWQTTSLFNNTNRYISMCINCHRIWIHGTTKRLHFI
jgi:hypothetical protein